jgi:hypothetical protein
MQPDGAPINFYDDQRIKDENIFKKSANIFTITTVKDRDKLIPEGINSFSTNNVDTDYKKKDEDK